jgi:hypothetical protein
MSELKRYSLTPFNAVLTSLEMKAAVSADPALTQSDREMILTH